MKHSTAHLLTVSAVDRITDDAVTITFDVPPELADDYAFVAGQHLNLRSPDLADDVRRSYSICCPPSAGRLQVAVKRLPGGAFSTWVHDELKAGDQLEVMTPTGRFFTPLDPQQAKRYCFIAVGSGITPVMALVSAVLETEPGSTVSLVYGNRTTASVMFLEEIADLKDRHPSRLAVFHALSREAQESPLLSGRLDAERLGAVVDALVPVGSVDEWFVCGPLPMTEAALEVLTSRGVDRARVHRELFHADAPPVSTTAESASGASVTFRLDGRTSTVPMPATGSILDAVLAERRDAPYACKNGVCGTCRARVVEGSAVMDHNYALEADELEAGFVLTCRSRPTTDAVTVDYDT